MNVIWAAVNIVIHVAAKFQNVDGRVLAEYGVEKIQCRPVGIVVMLERNHNMYSLTFKQTTISS